MAARRLAIVEDAHRGAAETQFADVLYLARELHRQLDGGVDLLLRGAAVSCALDTPFEPALTIAGRLLPTLPAPGRSVRDMLADGIGVLVDADDLSARGLAADRLLPGARAIAADALARTWPDYDGVWFL